jgi:DNA-binding transcriptional ArsR family regulator
MTPDFDALEQLEGRADATAQLLKAVANSQRLVILCHLAEGACSVNELAGYTRLSPSAVSQHLAKLRAAGVVSTRREAQTVWYQLAGPRATRLVAALCAL